jgi:AcrR family transcriptional regulator
VPFAPLSGRRGGSSRTRDDIVRAARKLFAERGYHGATMRAIASEAKVDPALIHHFFVSKEGVFSAAVGDSFKVDQIADEVLQPSVTAVGCQLISSLMGLLDQAETQGPILAVIRSAASYEDAVRLLEGGIVRQVMGQIVTEAGDSAHQSLRAALVSAEIVGLIMMRYVFKLEPLASAPDDVIARAIGPVIDRYVAGDLDLPAGYRD